MAKISVIVPIFNCSLYLDDCIQSVLNQSFSDFELFLINDGSTDNSPDLCRKWVQKDKRVIFYSKENEGVSSTRNFGLECCQSEYIIFVDGDDLLDKDALTLLYNTATNKKADITICSRRMLSTRHEYCHNYPVNQIFDFDLNSKWVEAFFKGDLETFVTNKLFYLPFLKKHKIKFLDYPVFEDYIFIQNCFLQSPKLFYIPDELYFYRDNINGALSKYHDKMFDAIIKIYENNLCLASDNIRCEKLILENAAGGVSNCIYQEYTNCKTKRAKIFFTIRKSHLFNIICSSLKEINISKRAHRAISLLNKEKFYSINILLSFEKAKRRVIRIKRAFKCKA